MTVTSTRARLCVLAALYLHFHFVSLSFVNFVLVSYLFSFSVFSFSVFLHIVENQFFSTFPTDHDMIWSIFQNKFKFFFDFPPFLSAVPKPHEGVSYRNHPDQIEIKIIFRTRGQKGLYLKKGL